MATATYSALDAAKIVFNRHFTSNSFYTNTFSHTFSSMQEIYLGPVILFLAYLYEKLSGDTLRSTVGSTLDAAMEAMRAKKRDSSYNGRSKYRLYTWGGESGEKGDLLATGWAVASLAKGGRVRNNSASLSVTSAGVTDLYFQVQSMGNLKVMESNPKRPKWALNVLAIAGMAFAECQMNNVPLLDINFYYRDEAVKLIQAIQYYNQQNSYGHVYNGGGNRGSNGTELTPNGVIDGAEMWENYKAWTAFACERILYMTTSGRPKTSTYWSDTVLRCARSTESAKLKSENSWLGNNYGFYFKDNGEHLHSSVLPPSTPNPTNGNAMAAVTFAAADYTPSTGNPQSIMGGLFGSDADRIRAYYHLLVLTSSLNWNKSVILYTP